MLCNISLLYEYNMQTAAGVGRGSESSHSTERKQGLMGNKLDSTEITGCDKGFAIHTRRNERKAVQE